MGYGWGDLWHTNLTSIDHVENYAAPPAIGDKKGVFYDDGKHTAESIQATFRIHLPATANTLFTVLANRHLVTYSRLKLVVVFVPLHFILNCRPSTNNQSSLANRLSKETATLN